MFLPPQVVWANSLELGCGYTLCEPLNYPNGTVEANSCHFFVCEYKEGYVDAKCYSVHNILDVYRLTCIYLSQGNGFNFLFFNSLIYLFDKVSP